MNVYIQNILELLQAIQLKNILQLLLFLSIIIKY